METTAGRVCGKVFDGDTMRCRDCQAQADAREKARRGTSSARGLGWAFTRRKQQDAAYQAAAACQCGGCGWHGPGMCGLAFTAANPKTAQHVTPRSRGGSAGPILAYCRNCNSSKGNRT
jgi:hypothetical protein